MIEVVREIAMASTAKGGDLFDSLGSDGGYVCRSRRWEASSLPD